jgi:predicted metal-dependent TIM-barrel fold hydrolase
MNILPQEKIHSKNNLINLKLQKKQINIMENILNVSVILPINSFKNKDFDTYFDRAIKSIQIQHTKPSEVVIVHSDEDGLKTKLETFDYSGLTVNFIENKVRGRSTYFINKLWVIIGYIHPGVIMNIYFF